MAKKTVAAKKRVVKVDGVGQLHVHSSFNNIIVTLANSEGQVISWSSAGKMGFRGSKKNTPYAAQMAAQDCSKVAFDLGLRKVKAYVKGPGNGREFAWENMRRRDLIRFGKFNDPTYVQYVSGTESYRKWFPIPYSVLEKSQRDEQGNPIWTQNPGYSN
jgi:small subunit ribosomal protein S11